MKNWLKSLIKKKPNNNTIHDIKCYEQDIDGFFNTYVNGKITGIKIQAINKEGKDKLINAHKVNKNK